MSSSFTFTLGRDFVVASTTANANPVANVGIGGRLPVGGQDVLRVTSDVSFERKKRRLICAEIGRDFVVASTTANANPVANVGIGGRLPVGGQDVLRVTSDVSFERKKRRLICAEIGMSYC
ncbi:hypothetical protein ACFX2I_029814 [Malus domestica]